MSRKRFYQVSALVMFVVASLSIDFLVWRSWDYQNVLIEKEQAIENAIQACAYIGLQQVEPPTQAEAQLTTWGTAQGPYNSDPERPV